MKRVVKFPYLKVSLSAKSFHKKNNFNFAILFVLNIKFSNFLKPSFPPLVSPGEDAEDEDGDDDSDEERETEADREEYPGLGLDHSVS